MLILVQICLYWNLTPYPYDENSWILTEYHFYIYNNKKNDFEFVQHYFKLHWQYMVDHGYAPQCH